VNPSSVGSPVQVVQNNVEMPSSEQISILNDTETLDKAPQEKGKRKKLKQDKG